MKKQKDIWVFGNPDYAPDALPLQLIPDLKKQFPNIHFITKDPNEEWDLPKHLTIIDTIQGIEEITTFTSLKHFTSAPNITMHDFDLLTNLRWLEKLDKLPPFFIIGIPPVIKKELALKRITEILTSS